MNKQEKIEYVQFVNQLIFKHFLLEDNPYLIQEGYENLREIFTLFGKQINILESTLLLLENNMAEEAYILFRSMLNNQMLIIYLCEDDESKKRFKDYMIQPVKTRIKFLQNLKKGVKNGLIKDSQEFAMVDSEIKEGIRILEERGYSKDDLRPLTIAGMAKTSPLLFGAYISLYNEGSKYEHSDPDSLKIYRQQLIDEQSPDAAFTFGFYKTDTELDEKLLSSAPMGCYFTFFYLHTFLKEKHEQLLKNYDQSELDKIALMIGRLGELAP